MNKDNLSEKHCIPCEGGVAPFSHVESESYIQKVDNWELEGDTAIQKILVFKDFSTALAFVNSVGKIAETENHHPDISIFSWNKVKIRISTHAIGGLSENDFILAAKIDEHLRAH
jgi:4a-hydroxytetrahydrobiopterin dehydratase